MALDPSASDSGESAPGPGNPPDAEGMANALAERLGENLVSVILHGPAAGGAGASEPAEQNLLVVVREMNLGVLDAVAPTVRAWMAPGEPPPLFFSEERLKRSASAYPVEFLDIKESRRVLCGSDPAAPLEVRKDNLLQEIDRGLKSQVHRLREARLRGGDSAEDLRRAIALQLPRTNLFLRSALRLLAPHGPAGMVETVAKLEVYLPGVSADLSALLAFAWRRDVNGEAPSDDPSAVLERAFAGLERLIEKVESMREAREAMS